MAHTEAADRVEAFTVTVPASTAASAPVTQALPLGLADVLSVEIVIPDGHAGLTGLRFYYSGEQIIPRSGWIIGNDHHLDWPLTRYPERGDWSARAYNTDVFEHSFYLRFLLSDLGRDYAAPAPLQLVTPIRLR